MNDLKFRGEMLYLGDMTYFSKKYNKDVKQLRFFDGQNAVNFSIAETANPFIEDLEVNKIYYVEGTIRTYLTVRGLIYLFTLQFVQDPEEKPF